MDPLEVTGRWTIPPSELSVSFSRSGGPGGQRVNKVETKVTLRFSLRESESVGDARRGLLLTRLGAKLTREGELVIQASEHRDQARNLEAARARLAVMLREGLVEQRARRSTRPTRGSRERRLKGKRQRGEIKRLRRSTDG